MSMTKMFQCRTQHCVCRDTMEDEKVILRTLFQCRTQHCVCRDTRSRSKCTTITMVSMPHAALCVSRPSCIGVWPQPRSRFNAARSIVCVETIINAMQSEGYSRFQCRTQHCVCRDTFTRGFCYEDAEFQCRTQHCVCRDMMIKLIGSVRLRFQCRTQHCVCRDLNIRRVLLITHWFQCRTQHCVCRDAVSRSPCPARAEKAFWKDALFCAVFGVCG